MFSGLPGLNPYYVEDKVSFSRTQHSASSESQTRDPLIPNITLYFILSSEINVYQKQIKVISTTSENIG